MRFCLILLSGFVLSFNSWGQDLNLKGLSSSWIQNGKLSSKWTYNIHVLSVYNAESLKFEEKVFPKGHCHLIPQLVLNRKLNNNLLAGIGFALSKHNIFGTKENEPRAIGQLMYTQSVSKLKIIHRPRLELRYPLNLKTNVRGNAAIGRYQVGLNYPLGKNKGTGFYLSASNEVFLYFKGATNGPVSSKNGKLISENWSSAGLGYDFSNSRIEIGYDYQMLVRNKKQDYRIFNLLQLTFQKSIHWADMENWWYH